MVNFETKIGTENTKLHLDNFFFEIKNASFSSLIALPDCWSKTFLLHFVSWKVYYVAAGGTFPALRPMFPVHFPSQQGNFGVESCVAFEASFAMPFRAADARLSW